MHKCCSRGDPRLKWREIRLNKASDLGHCIRLDGDLDFGLNDEGFPHCLARVPRGRGGYRFARSRAGLISAHFEYKDREFAAHEFEVSKAYGRANLQVFWCCDVRTLLFAVNVASYSLQIQSQEYSRYDCICEPLRETPDKIRPMSSWVQYTTLLTFPRTR